MGCSLARLNVLAFGNSLTPVNHRYSVFHLWCYLVTMFIPHDHVYATTSSCLSHLVFMFIPNAGQTRSYQGHSLVQSSSRRARTSRPCLFQSLWLYPLSMFIPRDHVHSTSSPHGEVRPFHRKSTCLNILNLVHWGRELHTSSYLSSGQPCQRPPTCKSQSVSPTCKSQSINNQSITHHNQSQSITIFAQITICVLWRQNKW